VLVREVQDPRSGHRICRTVVARHIEWQRQVVQETLCFEEHNTAGDVVTGDPLVPALDHAVGDELSV
jgi:hypothetical protein